MHVRTSSENIPIRFLSCVSVLGVILPVLAIVMTDGRPSFLLAIATCVTVYAGFRLSYLAFYSAGSILQLTFWIFVYCWLGLAAMVQLKAGRFPWPTATDSDDFVRAEVVVILGLAAYETGVRFSRKPTHARPAFFTLGLPSLGRFTLLTFACLAISSWAIYKKGGASEVVRTRYELKGISKRSGMAQSDLLTYTSLQRVPPVVSLLVSIYLFTQKRAFRRHRRYLTLILTGLILFNLVANYPPSLPRLYLGFILFSIASLILRSRAKLVPLFVLGMIVGLTVLFPYTDYFRTRAGYGAHDLEAPTQKLIDKPDYDVFQMISNTVKVVNERGVARGYNFLGAMLFFVPRAVWPEKPHGTGWAVGQQVGYLMLNLSSPLWAEFYYGGGIMLVIVGFWVYGYATRRSERQAFRFSTKPLFVAYAAGMQMFLLRGDLLNSVAYFAPGALLLFMFVGQPAWSQSAAATSTQVARSKMTGLQPRLLLGKD